MLKLVPKMPPDGPAGLMSQGFMRAAKGLFGAAEEEEGSEGLAAEPCCCCWFMAARNCWIIAGLYIGEGNAKGDCC